MSALKRGRGQEEEAEPEAKNAKADGKSELTVLAEKFKLHFCTEEASIGKDVNLNDVATVLQVSRRRLYDIVNVLEALQMVSRSGKLTYRWEGTAHLPKLLDMLYTDAMTGLDNGQCNPSVLEGHMPGSCWALTRRIVQQLLLDRGHVPLTLLVQRLDATLASANAGAGRTSLATVERRIYDIGSVLNTFGLVSKSLQGGSGPRHRQPVYQWAFDWDSQVPMGLPAASAGMALAPAAAGAAAPFDGLGVAAGAAAGDVPFTGLLSASEPMMPMLSSHPLAVGGSELAQQQLDLAAFADQQRQQLQQHMGLDSQPMDLLYQLITSQQADNGSVAQATTGFAAAALDAQQQQAATACSLLLQAASAAPVTAPVTAAAAAANGQPSLSAPAAVPSVEQRLQQVDHLVSSVLAQHGPHTCVTLLQLKELLCQIQETPAGPSNSRDELDQLDAAACLQQLKAGRGLNNGKLADGTQGQEMQSSLLDAARSSDQYCPGMTCFNLAAGLQHMQGPAAGSSDDKVLANGDVQQQLQQLKWELDRPASLTAGSEGLTADALRISLAANSSSTIQQQQLRSSLAANSSFSLHQQLRDSLAASRSFTVQEQLRNSLAAHSSFTSQPELRNTLAANNLPVVQQQQLRIRLAANSSFTSQHLTAGLEGLRCASSVTGHMEGLAQLRARFTARDDADEASGSHVGGDQQAHAAAATGATAANATSAADAVAGEAQAQQIAQRRADGAGHAGPDEQTAELNNELAGLMPEEHEGLDLRVSSNQLNNCQQQGVMRQLANAAAAGTNGPGVAQTGFAAGNSSQHGKQAAAAAAAIAGNRGSGPAAAGITATALQGEQGDEGILAQAEQQQQSVQTAATDSSADKQGAAAAATGKGADASTGLLAQAGLLEHQDTSAVDQRKVAANSTAVTKLAVQLSGNDVAGIALLPGSAAAPTTGQLSKVATALQSVQQLQPELQLLVLQQLMAAKSGAANGGQKLLLHQQSGMALGGLGGLGSRVDSSNTQSSELVALLGSGAWEQQTAADALGQGLAGNDLLGLQPPLPLQLRSLQSLQQLLLQQQQLQQLLPVASVPHLPIDGLAGVSANGLSSGSGFAGLGAAPALSGVGTAAAGLGQNNWLQDVEPYINPAAGAALNGAGLAGMCASLVGGQLMPRQQFGLGDLAAANGPIVNDRLPMCGPASSSAGQLGGATSGGMPMHALLQLLASAQQ